MLSSDLALVQSRESWEEGQGLSQGKLRIQPNQPEQFQSQSCIRRIHLDFTAVCHCCRCFQQFQQLEAVVPSSNLLWSPREASSGPIPWSWKTASAGKAAGKDQWQADADPTQLLLASSSHLLAQERASNAVDSKNPMNPLGGGPNTKQISCA